MKNYIGFLFFASMAYTGVAAPANTAHNVVREAQNTGVSFTSGRGSGNLYSNSFDTASCIFGGFFGGSGCRRPTSAQNFKNSSYDYEYSTNVDGTYKITITPRDEQKKPCTFSSVVLGGRRVHNVVEAAAVSCFQV